MHLLLTSDFDPTFTLNTADFLHGVVAFYDSSVTNSTTTSTKCLALHLVVFYTAAQPRLILAVPSIFAGGGGTKLPLNPSSMLLPVYI